ncbi:MAG: hypothetical protein IBX67_04645 [Dehalococcoidia bacterium]|nr:hypothetical protein [Dehalococcoidia bacterium]
MVKIIRIILALILIVVLVGATGCPAEECQYPDIDRESKIPATAVKITPETDAHPPILHSDEYEEPVPLPYPVNTAGAEDSAFVTPDGNTLYIWFTPDVRVPPERQLTDGVTGIYVSRKVDGQWQQPERVWLQDPCEVSLDGCLYVRGNELWFCSARKGNHTEIDMWKAYFQDGRWTNWQNAGQKLNVDYEIGEMHITTDGTEMYFHSDRAGGQGQYDIWVTRKVEGEWQEPENVAAVNTPENESLPFVTQDGSELWFTRTHLGTPAIFRSKKVDNEWQEPELIISRFAGEPSLDNEGNIYFTHHFFRDGAMIEADIYVAYRKQGDT